MKKISRHDRKSSVKRKIMITVISIIIVLGMINVFSIYNSNKTNAEYSAVLNRVSNAHEVTILINQIEPELTDYVLHGEKAEDLHYEEYVTNVEAIISDLKENTSDKEGEDMLDSATRLITNMKQGILQTEEYRDNVELSKSMDEKDNVVKVVSFINTAMEKYTFYLLDKVDALNLEIETSSEVVIMISVVLLISVLLIGFFVTLIIIKNISKPLKAVCQSAEQVATGDLMVKELHIKTRDEVQDLAHAFNLMVEHIKSSILHIRGVSNQVHSTSIQLSVIAEQNTKAGEDISQSVVDMVEGMKAQSQESNENQKSIKAIYKITEQIDKNDCKIVENTKKTVELAKCGTDNINEFVGQMDLIGEKIQVSLQTTEQLNKSSAEMNEMLEAIADIANHTNLLSLNASIEAARAGEAGRGFAVVAEEIRKLAANSTDFSQKIGEIINEVELGLCEMSTQMKENADQIDKGNVSVGKTQKFFEDISEASILVDKEMQANATDLQNLSKKMKDVDQSIEMNNKIVQDNEASSENISAAVQQQLASLEELTSEAMQLSELAAEMDQVVRGFKIENK